MRTLRDNQARLRFEQPTLKESRRVYRRYEGISKQLDECPRILELVHKDLERYAGRSKFRRCTYKSDTVFRCLLVMAIEDLSLRSASVHIDLTPHLRDFTRLFDGQCPSFATLDRWKNAIRPSTWKQINKVLVDAAVDQDRARGEDLRVDTTAVETNIHHPSDSSLLWDSYRVMSRLVDDLRKMKPEVVGGLRLHRRKVKRRVQKISRLVGKKNSRELMKREYERILHEVCRIRDFCTMAVEAGAREASLVVQATLEELQRFLPLIEVVIDQCTRRVLNGESVPNDEKIFSLFEPHTELLKRGKSWRSIEYGHMVQFEQVRSKIITGYEVFAKRPSEPELLRDIVERHKSTFGKYPTLLTTDKGYSERAAIDAIEGLGIRTAIGRKGRSRDAETRAREHSREFRSAQAFRAGIEGTIAFLKSAFGLQRCMSKGWNHFVSTIGLGVLAHNLIQLAC